MHVVSASEDGKDMLTMQLPFMQEAPMLYCGEEIGTGVDPKVC
jgi:hypothetical protein